MTKLRGFSLFELLLVLAIVSILIITGTRYYMSVRTNEQVNAAMRNIEALNMAYEKCHSDKAGLSNRDCSLKTMIAENYIPTLYTRNCDEKNQNCTSSANPWGGEINIWWDGRKTGACKYPRSAPYGIIAINHIPKTACGMLVARIAQSFSKGQCIREGVTWDFGDPVPTKCEKTYLQLRM